MKNVISFCLFGSNPMFTAGALRNAELAPKIYPNWSLLFWLGDSVPDNIVKSLVDAGADCRPSPLPNPMLARFLVNDLDEVERYIVRDTDSRLNTREATAVNEWIALGKAFHVIRDHPGHCVPMPGGLWGGTTGRFNMKRLLDKWEGPKEGGAREAIYNHDQIFLREMVWPLIKDDCVQHDFCTARFFRNSLPFPAKFGDWRFCGERFGADEQPENYKWELRMNNLSC